MTPDELREIRTRLGLTQEQMAEALGFAPTSGGRIHYTRMESGERSITARTERLVLALERSARTSAHYRGLPAGCGPARRGGSWLR